MIYNIAEFEKGILVAFLRQVANVAKQQKGA